MKGGQKACSSSPLAFRPVVQMVHFTNRKVLFCGWRKTQTFMMDFYIATHARLLMLAWVF